MRNNSTKETIRRAAAELFAKKGFAATSTREICQRAGITKPALYYHFGNKEQLYEELILDVANEYQKEIRRASRHGRTAQEKSINVLTAMFSFARHKQSYWRVGLRMVFAPEKESPAINYVELSQVDEKVLAEIAREGIRRGEMEGRPDQIAGAIIGIATTSIMGFLLIGKPVLDRSTARDIVDFLLEGCGCKQCTER